MQLFPSPRGGIVGNRFAGESRIITEGCQCIGLAIAQRFADEGAKLRANTASFS